MKYEKAMAEVVVLDNSDVITTSNCKNAGAGCPQAAKKDKSVAPNVVEEFWGDQG